MGKNVFLVLSILCVLSSNLEAQIIPFAFLNSSGGGGDGSDPCDASTPAIGALCSDGTYYAGRITINGTTSKVVTTPGACTDSPTGAGASGVTTAAFTPTCSGTVPGSATYDTLTKNFGTFSINVTAGNVDYVSWSAATKSTAWGSNSTSAFMAVAAATLPAASYCYYNRFGGHADWYLPSKSEMAMMICHARTTETSGYPNEDANCATYGFAPGTTSVIPGFPASPSDFIYWTSTTAAGTGSQTNASMVLTHYQSNNASEYYKGVSSDGMQSWAAPSTAYRVRCMRKRP